MEICAPSKKPCRISRCIGFVLLIIVAFAALSWLVMLLWNWLMPSLFMGVNRIDYCQAVGLLLLCKILFGSFRCYSSRRDHRERFENMSEEERAQLRNRLGSRWGSWCCPTQQTQGEDSGTQK